MKTLRTRVLVYLKTQMDSGSNAVNRSVTIPIVVTMQARYAVGS